MLTLVEDDNSSNGTLQFSASTYSVDENAGTVTLTVRRSGGSTGTVTVQYATSDDTATAGSEYTAASGTLSFLAGEVSKTFTVTLLQDGIQEGNETVTLTLSNAGGGASLGSPSTATLTLVDPDTNPALPRFDFGTTLSPVAAGYTQVTSATAYSSSLGYGWGSTGTLMGQDRSTGNDLVRDVVQAISQATFLVDVSNGSYQVSLTLGDASYSYDQMGVYLEGTQVDTVTVNNGQFVIRTYTVTVSDGQLTLKLQDLGGGNSLVVFTGLRLFPVPAASVAFSVANVYVSENGRTPRGYTYDATNQLTGEGTRNYSYDANGNRTMTGYETGTGNRLTSDGVWAYTYDYEGNLTKKSQGASAETWTFGYDHRNQMTWAEQRATDGGTLLMRADYKYDVFGRRIEKAVDPDGAGAQGTTTLRFVYVGQEVWADLNGSNALQVRYLHGDVVDQIFARLTPNGTAAWYLTDRQGSVRDVADASGAVGDHLEYDVFGQVLYESNPSFGDRYTYTGRERDSETSLLYYRARYYEPEIARLTTEDPKTFDAGDPNFYRYVRNNPTNATDPTGLDIFFHSTNGMNNLLQQNPVVTVRSTWNALFSGIQMGLMPGLKFDEVHHVQDLAKVFDQFPNNHIYQLNVIGHSTNDGVTFLRSSDLDDPERKEAIQRVRQKLRSDAMIHFYTCACGDDNNLPWMQRLADDLQVTVVVHKGDDRGIIGNIFLDFQWIYISPRDPKNEGPKDPGQPGKE